jgi:hypothetical protein
VKNCFFKEREKAFLEYEAKYLGTKEDIEGKIRQDTLNQIEQMQRGVGQHKQQVTLTHFPSSSAAQLQSFQVIVRLLQLVCDIQPELHHNLQLQHRLKAAGKV